MTSVEDIRKYIEYKKKTEGIEKPIFRIFMMENADKELVYPAGIKSGFPDMGYNVDIGYYWDIEEAVEAVKNNVCDIRETIYDAAFILCHFPGVYQTTTTESRMYFRWDEEKKQYCQEEEPAIFAHISL